MKRFDVQAIEIDVSQDNAFLFIADAAQLPRWTSAFASVAAGRAVLRTPTGEVEIELEVLASAAYGTVDWRMTFPDGSTASAFSRIVALDGERCVFCFVLTPPPVPLQQLEGAIDAQARTLAEELRNLKRLLELHE